jgi:hypothetical protein
MEPNNSLDAFASLMAANVNILLLELEQDTDEDAEEEV